MVSAQLFEAVPFYEGLTLDGLAGHGERWPAREQAAATPRGASAPFELAAPEGPDEGVAGLLVGRYRPIWAAREVEASPALKFLAARQVVELSPADARRLEVGHGEEIEVAANGHSIRGVASLRAGMPEGVAFVAEGTREQGANVLGDEPRVRIGKVAGEVAS